MKRISIFAICLLFVARLMVRRAFPFQPTMRSGFPHGRDGWISAAGSSWATMALALALGDLQNETQMSSLR